MAKRTWFSMAAASDGESADIAIYDVVGYYNTDASAFRDQLAALPAGVKTINLRINSPGGDVYQGVAIHNMLARHAADVIVTVDGLAASVASLIAMAGKQILMPENSAMLVHNPSGAVYGTAEDMDQTAGWLRSIAQGVVNTYVSANRKQTPRAEIEAMLAAETWMTAEEAVAKGFADKVVAPVELKMLFDLEASGYEKAPKWLMAGQPPAAKWVAIAMGPTPHPYRLDAPTEFTAAAAATAALEACGFKAGATPDPVKAQTAFLFHNEASPTLPSSYRMPIVTMVDGVPKVTEAALDAAAAELEAATDLDEVEKLAAGMTITGHRQVIAALKANAPAPVGDPAAAAAAQAAATRSKEILAACELAGVSAKMAREFVDGAKSLDEVRVLLLAAGSGGTGRNDIDPHNPGGSGGNDPDYSAGWDKAVARHNAPRERRHA